MNEEKYRDSIGWRNPTKWADTSTISRLKELAEEDRANADVFVLVGVGGSNQAARAVIEALKPRSGPEILYAGNSLSATAMREVLDRIQGKSVYINVIAKNFETLEPGVAFRILRVWMKQTYGEDYRRRIICTGTRESAFEKLCEAQDYRFLLFPDDIGGRFSAVSSVGLFPMAVAGISIEELVQGAVDEAWEIAESIAGEPVKDDPTQSKEGAIREHLVFRYARERFRLYQGGFRIELLVFFEPALQFFSKWWVQLFAESEGKQEMGMYPVAFLGTEDLHSTGQFVQDGTHIITETFLEIEKAGASVGIAPDVEEDGFAYLDGKDLDEMNRIAAEAVWKAHGKRNPCFRIRIPRLDAYWFGRLFYFFEYACYLSAEMLGVNPFDQPGVEAYKKLLFQTLGKKV